MFKKIDLFVLDTVRGLLVLLSALSIFTIPVFTVLILAELFSKNFLKAVIYLFIGLAVFYIARALAGLKSKE